MTGSDAPLIEVTDLVKHFGDRGFGRRRDQLVRAVDGVSLTVADGELVGLVGESGSGKTTLGQTVLRMHEPTSGAVRFRGTDLSGLSRRELTRLRPRMQYIFQDPFSALNPRLQIADAIGEPLLRHGRATRDDVRDRVREVLALCEMGPDSLDRFPHEFSGGQRQRIVIARAMALEPEFVVADEPVSALDVSIQAQIINLFSDLREQRGTAFLFISHDLGVVDHLCTRVAIMYRGVIVESGTRDQLFDDPAHPYTRELLAAVPTPDPRRRRRGERRPRREWDLPAAPGAPTWRDVPLTDLGDGHLVALPELS
ncbi:peptide/nickel transport system ATP-binding protein [Naumannella cuiyingiana]|uniref:Peptide/nickel transport system ATP-binding protein n=1 Tax=Naumannella cuiyingiana TaxID=1347891 RepID=A0A7Z0DC28_9ACTN|nr:peptide/nickel transport system ATP-binding protein [Naumannella cuiyingiana]